MPGVLAARSTSPVEGFIINPAVEEYIPPVVPVSVTVAVPAEQYGEAYAIVATGKAVTVMLAVAITGGHPFAPAIV